MSISTFQSACLFVIKNEGSEYTDLKADAGGPTKYGCTLDDYSTFMGRKMTANDVKNMSEATATNILKSLYWIDAYSELPQSVCSVILDWTFLHGVNSGRMMAQKAANELGAHIAVDGDFGPATIKALNALRPAYFISQFKTDILSYFKALVAYSPSQKVFLAGWTARINRYSSLV